MSELERAVLRNQSNETTQSIELAELSDSSLNSSDHSTDSSGYVHSVSSLEFKEQKLAQCNWYEVACTVLAGLIFLALHFVPSKLKHPLYIAFVFLALGSYCVYKCKCYGFKLVTKDWGLRFDNFKISFIWCSAVSVFAVCVMLIYMAIFKTGLPFNYHLILMFVLYPLWGIIQQFLIQALIACNLHKSGLNYYFTVFLTACSFTLVHFPNWLLMIATLGLGVTSTPIFLKYKCLYPLGIYHGWDGALIYWLVLEEDPLQRFL